MTEKQSNYQLNQYTLSELEEILQYNFDNKNLLLAALTHRSLSPNNYERLEFLGDSILSLVIARHLYCNCNDLSEGELSKQRSALVNHNTLSAVAQDINLDKYVLLGKAEKNNNINLSILADVLEAVIAAIFLDCNNIEIIHEIIVRLFAKYLTRVHIIQEDYKTELQEWLQAKKMSLPIYEVIAQNGPPHDTIFTIRCTIKDLSLSAQAQAKKKKEASQLVASKIIDLIHNSLT
jgi:ribonuclease-3